MEKSLDKPTFFSLGDSALIVDFGNLIALEVNDLVQRLSAAVERANFRGLIESVPAYASLTIFYDVAVVRRTYPGFATAFDAVRFLVEQILPGVADRQSAAVDSRLIGVPICFDPEFAPDLKFVALTNELSVAAVKTIFLAHTYTVFMLGFLPGFAYMGEVDERIATARKSEPRAKVAAGSVGIAGRQTGVYPLESPGGWQIIGRTPLRLFDPNRDSPAFFRPGDKVQFDEIGRAEFETAEFETSV